MTTLSSQICLKALHMLSQVCKYSKDTKGYDKQYNILSKELLRKFLFQTHPDFFAKNPTIQRINGVNIQFLQDIMNRESAQEGIPRSLIFYLKPDIDGGDPRKVKVTTGRILESIHEILETIGVAVPTLPSFYSRNFPRLAHSWIAAETMQITLFLQSIPERRDILRLKQQYHNHLYVLQKELLELSGLSLIKCQTSWSAHNNAVLLSRLIMILNENKSDLQLPWTGLSLRIGCNNGSSIDYAERELRLDCSQTVGDWISVFSSISRSQLTKMHFFHERIVLLKKLLEESISDRVGASASLVRGFTCCERSFALFMENMHSYQNVPPIYPKNSTTAENELLGRKVDLLLVVEKDHGVGVKQSGEIRLEATSSPSDVWKQILRDSARGIEAQKREEDRLKKEIHLVDTIRDKTGISEIIRGIGVTREMYMTFLESAVAYITLKSSLSKENNSGILSCLRDERLFVSHCASLAEDGRVSLPWDLRFDLMNQ